LSIGFTTSEGRAALRPKRGGGAQRIEIELSPPDPFVAAPVQLAVMGPAERHCEFVADLASQDASLRELEMVGIGWAAATRQTRLRADELEVISVAQPQRPADRPDPHLIG
jgi:hypothetical protein